MTNVNGGPDFESTLEDEWTVPPRFFASHSDSAFKRTETPGFRKIACEIRTDDDGEGFHPHVLTLEAV